MLAKQGQLLAVFDATICFARSAPLSETLGCSCGVIIQVICVVPELARQAPQAARSVQVQPVPSLDTILQAHNVKIAP